MDKATSNTSVVVVSVPDSYEEELVNIMRFEEVTLQEALYVDMWSKDIDVHSVFAIVEYLESRLDNLDKVEYYMSVYVGQSPDVTLKPNTEGEFE